MKEWENGLPPVGCECEFRIDHINWIRAEVLAHRDGSVIVWTSDGDAYYSCDHRKFRPIRSEEDRAVESIAWILADEFDATAADCEDAASALYAAGYRKTGGE